MRPDRRQMSLTPLQTMVDEAIEFMRANEPPEGYTLADSFGKAWLGWAWPGKARQGRLGAKNQHPGRIGTCSR